MTVQEVSAILFYTAPASRLPNACYGVPFQEKAGNME